MEGIINLGPNDDARSRAGGVKLTKMTSFPWSSAATSIVLYNRARHPSSYAFDGGGIRAAGRPRPRGRGGASTSLSSSVVVVDDAPQTSSPPSPTTHHRRHDVTLRLTSGEERVFRLLVDAAEATMPDR